MTMDQAAEKDAQTSNEDTRIDCSTTRGLQNIMNTVGKYVAELSDSVVELPAEREAFVKRFLGIFKSSLQENVTVNGLPWIPDKHTLSLHEKAAEEHNQKEVLVSRLCKSISDVGQKRKTFPTQCRKVLAMKHQHALENLEKTRVKVPKIVPTLPRDPLLLSAAKDIKEVKDLQKAVNEMAPKRLAETDKAIETFKMAYKFRKQNDLRRKNHTKKTPKG